LDALLIQTYSWFARSAPPMGSFKPFGKLAAGMLGVGAPLSGAMVGASEPGAIVGASVAGAEVGAVVAGAADGAVVAVLVHAAATNRADMTSARIRFSLTFSSS
jgi:hypothetical protein